MKRKRKIAIIIGTIIGIPIGCFILYNLYVFGLIYFTTSFVVKDVKERRVLLLYETDHKVLLQACRKVSSEHQGGKWKDQTYNIRRNPHPDASKFPKVILDLQPSYIFIGDNGRIVLEMLGGLHHFGVTAYPEDYNKPFSGFMYGDKKLIDGFWYYDDGYHEVADYDNTIEALRPVDAN